jgi:tRNA dimethylallyltransferase
MAATQPLIVIVGETASGKSALAVELARRLSGEIICADSRTVYIGMDIGTAKPTQEDRAGVPHHLLDIVRPDERYTVVDFKRQASESIIDISNRGKVPILVGGTGLYIDAVIYDYKFSKPEDAGHRDPQNPRHLLKDENRERQQILRPNTIVIGLSLERELLKKRVEDRVDSMLDEGLIAEVKDLGEKYGWEVPALQAPGYKAFREYLSGTITLDEAKAQFIKSDLNLAKRQRTWFKRNKSIHWASKQSEAVEIATTLLSKIQ